MHIGNFLDFFLRKIVEIVKKSFNKTPDGHKNSRKHVLWAINDVSTTNDAICAGEQERQKVKKGKK